MSDYNKIEDAVKAIGEQFRKVIEQSQKSWYERALAKYKEAVAQSGETDPYVLSKKFRHLLPDWVREPLKGLLDAKQKKGIPWENDWFVRPNVSEIIAKSALKDSEMIIASFIGKMTKKLEDVVSNGASFNVIGHGTGPTSNTLQFRFTDGGQFTIINQVVTVWGTGNPFYRYPTTFHNAVLANGQKVANPSEAAIKLAFGGVDIKNKPVDPSICPASGKPWPGTAGRLRYRKCPECGAVLPYENLRGQVAYNIRKHKKNVNESADVFTIIGWLKRNKDLFDKDDLIRQLMSRFHINKDQALAYVKQPLTEYKMIGFNKYKLEPDEEDALMWWLAKKALKPQGGELKFSRSRIALDLAKWYEDKGWLTQKQCELLANWKILDKTNLPTKESFGGSYARPSNYPVQSGFKGESMEKDYIESDKNWYSGVERMPIVNALKKAGEHPIFSNSLGDAILQVTTPTYNPQAMPRKYRITKISKGFPLSGDVKFETDDGKKWTFRFSGKSKWKVRAVSETTVKKAFGL